MGRFKATWLWSLATVALLAGIPQSSCGSSSKNAIKLVKPTGKPDSMVSRRQHPAPLSVEDDENYSGNRPNFGPFPQGFSQGPPQYSRYADEPSDRYDVEDAPADRDNNGMGFMPEFGPPKGFPDLSKLTGGEFPKMDTPAQNSGAGQIENVPQYSTYPGGDSPKSYRPFPQYSPQGGPGPNYDDSEDGPGGPAFGNYGSPNNSPPQSAPRRKPFRNSRPPFGGGRPQGFGGPGGPGGPYGGSDGPSSFGAPDGLNGGPGSYRGSSALEGSSRPFGGSSGRPSRPSSPFGNSPDGPSYRPGPGPFGPDGPSSRPGFGSDGPSSRPGFGSDGPSSRPGFGSDGPSSSRSPFGGSTSDTPYGLFGSDGPPSRPGFGSDGPQSRPGFGSSGPPSRPSFGLDGPPSRSPFIGSSSDGPSYRPGGGPGGPGGPGGLFGSEGPSSRPPSFGPGGPPSRSPFISNSDIPDSSDGPSSYRPSSFGSDGPSSRSPSFGPDGPSSRPNPFGSDGPSSRPSSFGPDGPSARPSPFGSDGPPSRSPFGGGPDGPNSSPGAFSFQNAGPGPGPNPGYRLSRGYPRHHPNTVQNDDFKESADGDFSPFNGPPQFSYPPRQHSDYSRHEDYPRGPHPQEGPRSRRPEYLPHHSNGGPFGPTHRHDSLKRPVVLKVSGLKSKYIRELPPGPPIYYAPSPDMRTKDTSRKFQDKESHPEEEREASPRAKSYLVKSRPKRDLVEDVANITITTTTTTTTTSTTTTAPPSSSQSCNSRRCKGTASVAKKNNDRRRKPNTPPKIMRIFNATSTNTNNISTNNTRVISTNTTRQASSKSLKSSSEDPMLADGTQQTAYWDVASPYGTYNPAYKKQAVGVTAHDRHDEYEVEEDESTAPAAVPIRMARRNQTYHDTTSDEQRFFPSFPAPPSPYLNPFGSNGGFARPPLFPGPTANRAPSRFHPQFGPKYTAPPPNRGPSSAYPAESHERYLHTNLLGSGNFEVVRGGTYYGDDDDGYHHTTGSAGHYHQDDDDGYFHHNGHSSPHGYRNNPSAGGGDFFANFRDFADINPPTRSFSHHHETVADAEPHGSASHESLEQPKNILDKLQSSSDKIEVHQPFTSSSSSSSRDLDPMMATY